MLYDEIIKKHKDATLLRFFVGSGEACLSARPLVPSLPEVCETLELPRPVRRVNGVVLAPVKLFSDGLFAYVTVEDGAVTVERSGRVARLPLDGVYACEDRGVILAAADVVISRLELDFAWLGDECQVIVESRVNGPRPLTPAEERLPYAKYWRRYWETPFHERADYRTWARKAGLYAAGNMQDPATMLHLSDVN